MRLLLHYGHYNMVLNIHPSKCMYFGLNYAVTCLRRTTASREFTHESLCTYFHQLPPYKERLVTGKTTNLAAMIIANWFHFSIILPTFSECNIIYVVLFL